MEVIIILLIAVEVVIVSVVVVWSQEAEFQTAQVLIREGPELGHKLANPIIRYVKSVIDPDQTSSQVFEKELPKMREAVERLPHLGVSPSPIPSDDRGERLV